MNSISHIRQEIVTTFFNTSDKPVKIEEITRNYQQIASKVQEQKQTSSNPIFKKNDIQQQEQETQENGLSDIQQTENERDECESQSDNHSHKPITSKNENNGPVQINPENLAKQQISSKLSSAGNLGQSRQLIDKESIDQTKMKAQKQLQQSQVSYIQQISSNQKPPLAASRQQSLNLEIKQNPENQSLKGSQNLRDQNEVGSQTNTKKDQQFKSQSNPPQQTDEPNAPTISYQNSQCGEKKPKSNEGEQIKRQLSRQSSQKIYTQQPSQFYEPVAVNQSYKCQDYNIPQITDPMRVSSKQTSQKHSLKSISLYEQSTSKKPNLLEEQSFQAQTQQQPCQPFDQYCQQSTCSPYQSYEPYAGNQNSTITNTCCYSNPNITNNTISPISNPLQMIQQDYSSRFQQKPSYSYEPIGVSQSYQNYDQFQQPQRQQSIYQQYQESSTCQNLRTQSYPQDAEIKDYNQISNLQPLNDKSSVSNFRQRLSQHSLQCQPNNQEPKQEDEQISQKNQSSKQLPSLSHSQQPEAQGSKKCSKQLSSSTQIDNKSRISSSKQQQQDPGQITQPYLKKAYSSITSNVDLNQIPSQSQQQIADQTSGQPQIGIKSSNIYSDKQTSKNCKGGRKSIKNIEEKQSEMTNPESSEIEQNYIRTFVKKDDLEYEQYDDQIDSANNYKAIRQAGSKRWQKVSEVPEEIKTLLIIQDNLKNQVKDTKVNDAKYVTAIQQSTKK